MLIEVKL